MLSRTWHDTGSSWRFFLSLYLLFLFLCKNFPFIGHHRKMGAPPSADSSRIRDQVSGSFRGRYTNSVTPAAIMWDYALSPALRTNYLAAPAERLSWEFLFPRESWELKQSSRWKELYYYRETSKNSLNLLRSITSLYIIILLHKSVGRNGCLPDACTFVWV